MGYFWDFYRVNCICYSVFGPFWAQPYTHIYPTLSIPDIVILSNIGESSMVTSISKFWSRKSFPWKILRWRNFKIITGELGQNDLLKIIDYSTDNGRIGFRMMNFFHFVNHRNAFLFHRNHVIIKILASIRLKKKFRVAVNPNGHGQNTMVKYSWSRELNLKWQKMRFLQNAQPKIQIVSIKSELLTR